MTEPNADGAPKEPEAGQQAPATSDAPATERNADEDENRGKLIASLQEKAARVNAAEAEAARLKAHLDALTRAQSPAANGGDPRAERLKAIRDFAEGRIGEGSDPVAAELLETRNELSLALQEIANMRELDRVPDEDKRKKVAQHFNNNRHRLGDVRAALNEIEADERAEVVKKQEEELARLRKSLEAQNKRPAADVVQTHTREVGAAEHKEIMTRADWQAEQAELERRYDEGDVEAGRLRRKRQLEVAQNKLTLKD